jgi:hypothetical protein
MYHIHWIGDKLEEIVVDKVRKFTECLFLHTSTRLHLNSHGRQGGLTDFHLWYVPAQCTYLNGAPLDHGVEQILGQ